MLIGVGQWVSDPAIRWGEGSLLFEYSSISSIDLTVPALRRASLAE